MKYQWNVQTPASSTEMTSKEENWMETAMSEKRSQITFTVDEKTLDLIELLKVKFCVGTNAAALRRALAIARLAAENQRDDHTITFIGKDDRPRDIVLSG